MPPPNSPGSVAVGKVSLTGGNITTSSNTFVDLTGATVTLTTGARRCLVVFNAWGSNGNSGQDNAFDIAIDGVRQGGTFGLLSASNTNDTNFSFSFLTDVLSAGVHTIKIQWRTTAGTGTVFASSTSPTILSVIELPNEP